MEGKEDKAKGTPENIQRRGMERKRREEMRKRQKRKKEMRRNNTVDDLGEMLRNKSNKH